MYEFFIARRYLTAKRKQAFISVITFVSALGFTIGVMALIIALALITGFQDDIQDKILGLTSHVSASDLTGEGLRDYSQLIPKIESINGVQSVSPVVYQTVLISGPVKNSGAVLKGIDFEREVKESPWLQKLESGKLPTLEQNRPGILLGREMAFSIGALVGDVVTILTSSANLSPVGLFPRTKRFVVSGIFNTGLYEFDSTHALVSLETAQKFLDMEGRISYLQVKLDDIFQAEKIARQLRRELPSVVYVSTWMEQNRSLFSALKLEKNVMFFTIALIIFVAALNIIASLILMVMEKTRDIGILKAMGATARNIRKIFFFQGAMIGVIGTASGVILGLFCCWLANTFKLIKVPVDIYMISHVPFHVKVVDVLMIVGVSLLISFLSTLFPSHRASRVDPVIALKYE
ncbi:MAG: lipoprotein-releasing ABC transporter permease subunit [Candidatus Aminicenantales bacterium]